MATPCFVLVEMTVEHARHRQLPDELAGLVRSTGGRVLAAAPAGRIACLEPGTISAGMVVSSWSDPGAARRAVEEKLLPHLKKSLPSGATPLVLAVEALPDEGLPDLPDIPTTASVPRPTTSRGNVLLIVRGSAWDQSRLDQYRDVILPMHKEHGGYYEVFAVAPGQVEPLAGEWQEQIFAISRWPTRAAAEDFWYSERYQTVAIPLRLGAGHFSVHMIEAAPE